MALRYANRFNHHPSVIPLWEWHDSEAADADLLDFIAETAEVWSQDFTVDRTGSTPELVWQRYDWGHVGPGEFDYDYVPINIWGAIQLDDGVLLARNRNWGAPAPHDMTGFWESDEYGRPYNLNDLLADTP